MIWVISLLLSTGLLLFVSGVTERRHRFADRLTPYIDPAGSISPVKRALLRLPQPVDISLRLAAAGRSSDRGAYTIEKLTWAGAAAVGLAGFAMRGGDGSLIPSLLVGGAVGWLARDRWLVREGRIRARQLRDEIPYALDLFTIAVVAGEGVAGALVRSSESIGEPLRSELSETCSQMRSGVALDEAFADLRSRCPEPAIGRVTDALTIALERGTPVVETLEALARDLREEERRALLEGGARRELAMLLPVVFLLLPVIVVFALYPGLVSLEMLVL